MSKFGTKIQNSPLCSAEKFKIRADERKENEIQRDLLFVIVMPIGSGQTVVCRKMIVETQNFASLQFITTIQANKRDSVPLAGRLSFL